MTKATEALLDAYRAEFIRVRGKVPAICMTSPKSVWIEIERNFYRKRDVAVLLKKLKALPSFPSLPEK